MFGVRETVARCCEHRRFGQGVGKAVVGVVTLLFLAAPSHASLILPSSLVSTFDYREQILSNVGVGNTLGPQTGSLVYLGAGAPQYCQGCPEYERSWEFADTYIVLNPHGEFYAQVGAPYGFGKPVATVEWHKSRAQDYEISSATLALITTVSGLESSVRQAIGDFVAGAVDLIFERHNSAWGVGLSVFLAAAVPAVLAYAGILSATAAVGSVLLLTMAALAGAWLDANAALHNKLAADPPDPDYEEVFQYSAVTWVPNPIFGEEGNAYLADFFSILVRSTESAQGQLVSLERAVGAGLMSDAAAFERQVAALRTFEANYVNDLLQLARLLDQGLVLLNDYAIDPSLQVERYYASAQMLFPLLGYEGAVPTEPPPVGVPEPPSMCLLLLGLIIVATSNKRRRPLVSRPMPTSAHQLA